MAITILPPVVEDINAHHEVDSDIESMSIDSDGGVDLAGGGTTAGAPSRPSKKPRLSGLGNNTISTGIVTPGELVTDDPQWMR